MAKIYTVEEAKEMYKNNFYVQHENEMSAVDKTPNTPEIDEAPINVQFDVIDEKYNRKHDDLARAQYYHYCYVKNGNKGFMNADIRKLLIDSGVEL